MSKEKKNEREINKETKKDYMKNYVFSLFPLQMEFGHSQQVW
jgi:hypothetical protein